MPRDSSEEEEEEEETESDEDSDASSMDDFVMKPHASQGGKSSSSTHKCPVEEEDDDIGVSSPLPKKQWTMARKQRVRRDLEVFYTASPPVITFAEGQSVEVWVLVG